MEDVSLSRKGPTSVDPQLRADCRSVDCSVSAIGWNITSMKRALQSLFSSNVQFNMFKSKIGLNSVKNHSSDAWARHFAPIHKIYARLDLPPTRIPGQPGSGFQAAFPARQHRLQQCRVPLNQSPTVRLGAPED